MTTAQAELKMHVPERDVQKLVAKFRKTFLHFDQMPMLERKRLLQDHVESVQVTDAALPEVTADIHIHRSLEPLPADLPSLFLRIRAENPNNVGISDYAKLDDHFKLGFTPRSAHGISLTPSSASRYKTSNQPVGSPC